MINKFCPLQRFISIFPKLFFPLSIFFFFLECIDDLTVLDFSKCFSDVHTPLSITFESNAYENSDSDINALDNTEHIVKIKK
jgi:hypothetical protein